MSDKQRQLKKHKAIATGLFVAMACVYISMTYWIHIDPAPWMGYVSAFSEAAMVGALADWFAVTALFKYPLGIKIPHTNLIENSKNAIGENLGNFVEENFLTSANIRPYVEKLDLASILSEWLSKEKNRINFELEIQSLLKQALQRMEDEKLKAFLTQKAQDGISSIQLHKVAAQGIHYALEQGEHNRLIDFLIPKAQSYISVHREAIYQKVVERKPLLGLIGGKAITNQLIEGISTFLEDVMQDPAHPLREEVTTNFETLALEIEEKNKWEMKFADMMQQFLPQEKIKKFVSDFLLSIKDNLAVQLTNPDSPINTYLRQNIQKAAKKLQNDSELKNRINNWIRHTIYKVALKNTHEISALIQNTVAHWDGKELSQKLELEVGKDLQFIRINGTLVGGFVGVLIYTITQLIF